MDFTAETYSSDNGNRKPCSVVVPTERVFMYEYLQHNWIVFCRGHRYCNRQWKLFHVTFNSLQLQIVLNHMNRDIIYSISH